MNELLSIDREHIWHPFTPLTGAADPLLITSAQGIYLHTHDGRKIIDAISSWWVNLHGHAHPDIAKALAKQAETLEHVIFAGFTHEPAIRLAKNLLSILPENQERIFYSDNGSTAVEVALKMAMQFWHNQKIEKRKIIALKGAYHGDTFGAMSVAARSTFTNAFLPYLFEVEFIDFPSRGNEDAALKQFIKIAETGDVGIFIFEPLIQAAAGMRMCTPEILSELITRARKHNIICIADEVFTGFGRTGKNFASEYLSSPPDIITLSKGITGGALPLGVTTCCGAIVKAFESADKDKTFYHGHSYTANPLACAAANASFELLNRPSCQQNISRISEMNEQFCKKIAAHSKLKDARAMGTILALELEAGESSYFNDIRKLSYSFFLERNILLRPLGNVIYIVPPYIITAAELMQVYDCISDFLDNP